jgi:hypothetical protein
MSGAATAPQGVTASQPRKVSGLPKPSFLVFSRGIPLQSFLVANRDPSTSLG